MQNNNPLESKHNVQSPINTFVLIKILYNDTKTSYCLHQKSLVFNVLQQPRHWKEITPNKTDRNCIPSPVTNRKQRFLSPKETQVIVEPRCSFPVIRSCEPAGAGTLLNQVQLSMRWQCHQRCWPTSHTRSVITRVPLRLYFGVDPPTLELLVSPQVTTTTT